MSTNNKNNNNHKDNGNRRQRQKQGAGFVTSLSPEAQVNKVMADIANLNQGYHLKYWSASARKELAPHITIKVEVNHKGNKVDVVLPKLAFLAASPVFQRHMQEHPSDVHINLVHADVTKDTLETIAKWLRKICSEKEYSELPCPNDMEKALELRLTARTLGMSQYVVNIMERYIDGLGSRVPQILEIKLVVKFTRDDMIVDPMMEALANRLAFLVTYHRVDEETEIAYAKLLAEERFGRLLNAAKGHKVKEIAERGWEPVYRRRVAYRASSGV
jgi:hypothetical protein